MHLISSNKGWAITFKEKFSHFIHMITMKEYMKIWMFLTPFSNVILIVSFSAISFMNFLDPRSMLYLNCNIGNPSDIELSQLHRCEDHLRFTHKKDLWIQLINYFSCNLFKKLCLLHPLEAIKDVQPLCSTLYKRYNIFVKQTNIHI